jgi:hypothetical protein
MRISRMVSLLCASIQRHARESMSISDYTRANKQRLECAFSTSICLRVNKVEKGAAMVVGRGIELQERRRFGVVSKSRHVRVPSPSVSLCWLPMTGGFACSGRVFGFRFDVSLLRPTSQITSPQNGQKRAPPCNYWVNSMWLIRRSCGSTRTRTRRFVP